MTRSTQDPIYGRALQRPRFRRQAATPLVVVHGGGAWEDLRGHLGRREPVVLALPAGEPDAQGWLVRELEALGRPADVVGHDRAALVVQAVVRAFPHLVRSWALLGLDHQRRVQLLVAAGMAVLPAEREARRIDPGFLGGGPLGERLGLAA